MFQKWIWTWLYRGSYGVYVAITVLYVAVTRCSWQPSSKRHVDPVTSRTPYLLRAWGSFADAPAPFREYFLGEFYAMVWLWSNVADSMKDFMIRKGQAWMHLKIIWSTCSMTTSWHELPIWTIKFDVYPVINEVVVLIKIVEKNEIALIRQRCCRESTYCQSIDTEKAYVGQY